jgi:hypothetical protein
MIQMDSNAKIDINIDGQDGDDHVLIMVVNDTVCDLHRMTLGQARALSMAIIKQVYRAERLKQLNSKPTELAPVQAFSFRQQHQF